MLKEPQQERIDAVRATYELTPAIRSGELLRRPLSETELECIKSALLYVVRDDQYRVLTGKTWKAS